MENTMKVRVKEDKQGFIYGSMRSEGTEFTLKPIERKGKDTITVEQQFSKIWMEKVGGRSRIEH